MRVDLGDSIHQMKLLGDEEFFCQTEKEIRIYNLNQVVLRRVQTSKCPNALPLSNSFDSILLVIVAHNPLRRHEFWYEIWNRM